MPRVTHQIEISRAPADVFAFLADFDNDSKWRENVLAMRPLGKSGDLGGIWSRQVEVRKVPGRTVETEALVTASEPGRLLSIKRATGPVRPEAIYRLTAVQGRTRLSFELVICLAGLSWLALPLVWLLLALVVRPALRKDFARLKELLER